MRERNFTKIWSKSYSDDPHIYIYTLRCMENGKVYVGRTKNPLARRTAHYSALIHGRHINKVMQEDANKYGIECFLFEVIEKTEGIAICHGFANDTRERYWMMKYKSYLPEYGYNFNDSYFTASERAKRKKGMHYHKQFPKA